MHRDFRDVFKGVTCLVSIQRPVTATGEAPAKQWHLLPDYKISVSDPGCLALDLGTGSLLYEVARQEWHATTAIPNADRRNPARMAMVLSQHEDLDLPLHGQRVEMAGLHPGPLNEAALLGLGFK